LVWFEMLTGQLPFKPSSSPALPALERLTRPVPAPSSLNPRVPSELDAIVLACLRRSSTERLQTAAEVLARLEALASQKPAPPRRRTLAPWTVAAVVLASALYFVLGKQDRTADASANEPRPAVVNVLPAAVKPVESPVAEAVAAPQEPEPSARPASKARPGQVKPLPKPRVPDPKTRDDEGGETVKPVRDPHHGWENPFPETG
jgi:serine/threonine-protein kinase